MELVVITYGGGGPKETEIFSVLTHQFNRTVSVMHRAFTQICSDRVASSEDVYNLVCLKFLLFFILGFVQISAAVARQHIIVM